jgi:hypothetical protein
MVVVDRPSLYLGMASPAHGNIQCSRARGPPKVLLDRKGELVYNLKTILARFSQHFVGVLGGGTDLTDEVRE